jgi:hypothetical protein
MKSHLYSKKAKTTNANQPFWLGQVALGGIICRFNEIVTVSTTGI